MKRYLPLIVLLSLCALAAWASPGGWMHNFMGLFLVMFSMLKLFDLPGFANGFQKYDLLAKRLRLWALIYPFLELGLGLAYLKRWQLETVYLTTIFLMSFGALGVFSALKKGLNVKCACMGTSLSVPLSTVAIVEDLGMVAMAIVMLLI